ncbi:MAG TPA: hypothetical protein VJ914_34955 [Pseudonocardiaceae bacterium]|nr:hypothetical protein [Pseudonocardiaceae bacterium]
MSFPRGAGLFTRDQPAEGWRHAETANSGAAANAVMYWIEALDILNPHLRQPLAGKKDDTVPIPLRALALSVPAAVVLVVVGGCGSKEPTGTSSGAAPTTGAHQVFQHRSLACGTGVDAPAQPSKSADDIQLAVSGAHLAATEIDTSYAITTPDRDTAHGMGLLLPIGPTPVTMLLLRDGKIVARQQPPGPNGTLSGAPATEYDLTTKPYTGSARIDQLCPGTTWEQIAANHSRYMVEVLMSRQPQGGPQTSAPPAYLPDPLTVASISL